MGEITMHFLTKINFYEAVKSRRTNSGSALLLIHNSRLGIGNKKATSQRVISFFTIFARWIISSLESVGVLNRRYVGSNPILSAKNVSLFGGSDTVRARADK